MTEQAEPIETELEIIAPSALESIERANVDIQITTARKYPRRLSIVKQRMLNLATLDEETAASCFYRLNRQGKAIEGPSIRLAEIAASSFGNLRYGARAVANDGKRIVAQGFCHDLETNVLFTIEVQRRITDKYGKTYSEDMQTVTGNAACAIAARNAIFKVVPFAFVKPIFLAAKQTAVGDLTTLAERRTKMIAKFAALGVTDKKITESLGKSGMEEIGLGELETLIGLYNAIRDGDQTIEEAFPSPKTASDGIQFGPSGVETKPEPEPEPEPSVVPETPQPPPAPVKRGRGRPRKIVQTVSGGVTTAGKEQPEDKAVESASGSRTVPTPESKAAPAPPPARATPLQALRNMINSSPISEEEFRRKLIEKMVIDPHEKLDGIADDKLKWLAGGFMPIANEIIDGPSEEKPVETVTEETPIPF